jgi:hypothetical protein
MKKDAKLHPAAAAKGGGVLLVAVLLVLSLLSAAGWSAKAKPEPQEAKPAAATPQPEKILQQMCDYLKAVKQFSFKAECTDDRVYTGGKKLQFAFDLEAYVRRPDRVRVNAAGDLENKEFFYDGKTITLYDKSQNHYAVMPAPATIDAAMAKAEKEYGLRVSLVDLAESNPCALMTKGVKNALYVGEGIVRGVKCHHLAFDRAHIQWQIWIEAGEKPLPRKLIITQKKLLGSPQWTAYFTEWNLSPQLSDNLFAFTPPEKASKIKFVPLKQLAASQAKPAPGAKKKAAAKQEKKKGD